jgi:hypothetical protein
MLSRGLTPQDFKRLPSDGEQFEALVFQLLEAMGYRILEKPARGPEGGRDVLIERVLGDSMTERRERVVVQCKHYAHSGRAISDREVGVWQNVMIRYRARGYLLVTDTRVAENLRRSFREFTEDEANYPKWAAFWDVDEVIRHLNEHPDVRDTFFPPPPPPFPVSLANEVKGLLEAMGFEIPEGTFKGNFAEFQARRITTGEDINRWYLCLETKITSHDIEKLQGRIDNTTATGWIVTSYAIDHKIRQQIEAHPSINAYTLANFYRQMLQYDRYLKELIKSSEEEVDRFWVDLECRLNGDEPFNLVEYVDKWLGNSQTQNQLALSGDFGTGKTWFCRYYAARLARQHLQDPNNYRIPILISLRGYAKALKIEQLITDTVVNTYQIDLVGGFETFMHLNECGRLLLIFDGFDEMEQRVDYTVALRNYEEISRTVTKASKVILTSRPLYFADAEKLLKPKFETLKLEVFNDDQIKAVLRKRLGDEWNKYWERISKIQRLRDLASRPVMTQIISETLPAIPDLEHHIDSAALYRTYADVWIQKALEVWIERALRTQQILNSKQVISIRDKVLSFIYDLAWEMFRSPTTGTISKEELEERIENKLGTEALILGLEKLFVLDRVTGNLTFPHISFMEFFVADRIAQDLSQGRGNSLFSCTLTDGVQKFLIDLIHSKPETQKGILDALVIAQPGEQTDTLTELLTRLGEGNPVEPIINMLAGTARQIELPQHVVEALGKEEFLDKVMQLLKHKFSPSIYHLILELLGSLNIRAERALKELTKAIYQDDGDDKIRLHAVEILGKRQGELEIQALINAVGNRKINVETRKACIDSIHIDSLTHAEIRQQALEMLHQVISDDDDKVEIRQQCIIKLAEFDSREALAPLLDILKKFDHDLWLVSASILHRTSVRSLANDIEEQIIKPNQTNSALVLYIAHLRDAVNAIEGKI